MITSASNAKIKLVRALLARRSERQAEQAFVIEGVRLAEEAAAAEAPARLVLHTDRLDPRGRAAMNQLARLGAQVEAVAEPVMAAASDAQTPPGILAVVGMAPRPLPAQLTLALVLDGLADPGNAGTLLRTADAAGLDAVFLAPGSVDAYNPKVVRAAMGAHFHLPIIEADWSALAAALAGLRLWRAEAHAGEPYAEVDWRAPSALLVGAEAAGPSPAGQALAPAAVHIPAPGRAESLNAAVAAAVIVFEALRQRSVYNQSRP